MNGTTMRGPVDEVDDVVGPMRVFEHEVFTQAASTKGMTESGSD